MTDEKKLTTVGGAPLVDENVLTGAAGPERPDRRRGPMLLEDVWFLESARMMSR